jgi:hypothetical protein
MWARTALADFKLSAELRRLRDNVKAVGPAYGQHLDAAMTEAAAQGEARMKERAPWHDNTGAARAALTAVPELDGDQKKIEFAHGVSYGIYLETKHHGKDQIIMPTVKAVGEDLMARLEGSLGDIDERAR